MTANQNPFELEYLKQQATKNCYRLLVKTLIKLLLLV